jgi:hypothetical protein
MDVNDARFDDGDEPMEALPDDVLTALRSVEIDQLARERAITAALAAAARRRRFSSTSLLGAAAAALLVVAGAAIVLPRGGDDSGVTIESTFDAALADGGELETIGTETADDAAGGAADDAAVIEQRVASEEYSADEPAAAEAAPAVDTVIDTDDEAEEADAASSLDDGAVTPEELFDEAAEALAAIQSGDLKPPVTDCVMMGGGPVLISRFRGVEVVVFADLANGSVTALATSDCSFVVAYQPEP